MNAISDVLVMLSEQATALQLGTLAGAADWSLYEQRVPDSPNRCVVLMMSPAPAPVYGLNHAAGVSSESFPFQLRVRGMSPADVDPVRIRIVNYLFSLTRFVRGSYTYEAFTLSSGPIPLGFDERERYTLVQNLICTRK